MSNDCLRCEYIKVSGILKPETLLRNSSIINMTGRACMGSMPIANTKHSMNVGSNKVFRMSFPNKLSLDWMMSTCFSRACFFSL